MRRVPGVGDSVFDARRRIGGAGQGEGKMATVSAANPRMVREILMILLRTGSPGSGWVPESINSG